MTQASSAPAADPFAAPAPPPSPSAAATPSTTSEAATLPDDPFGAPAATEAPGLSGQDWAIALGVVLAASILWWFVRGFVETALARNHAPPDAASGAAWSLFGLLVVLTATLAFGVVGNLWNLPLFLWPALILNLLLLVLTIMMVLGANRRRR